MLECSPCECHAVCAHFLVTKVLSLGAIQHEGKLSSCIHGGEICQCCTVVIVAVVPVLMDV